MAKSGRRGMECIKAAAAKGVSEAAAYASKIRATHPAGPCTFCAAPAAHLYCSAGAYTRSLFSST